MLAGKTLVVTGAASGIGEETARVAVAEGARVIAVDQNEPTVSVDKWHRADLSDKSAIDDLISRLPAHIDGLANVAGLPPTHPPASVLKVNLVGLKYLTTRMISRLSDGASIVNLASLAGLGWPQSIEQIKESQNLHFDQVDAFCRRHRIAGARSYFLSKEALIVWTMQNRWSWRERGIRMNSVSPGPVSTPILKDFIETLGARAEEDMRVMDRPGTPHDIAPVVTFLLSDGSKWIRGTNIPADGGMYSHLLLNMHHL